MLAMVFGLTRCLLELFAKIAVLDILEIFRLDIGHISFNLVKKVFATQQRSFLSTSIAFYDNLAWARAEIKIFRLSFWRRK